MSVAALERLDTACVDVVRRRRRPRGVRVARAVSAAAEPDLVYPLLFAVGSQAANGSRRRDVLRPVLVVASGAGLRALLAERIGRPRPPQSIWRVQPKGHSLPSRHTTLAALTGGACARALAANRARRPLITATVAGVVGASRVWLGVHWPTDVLAGWLFAEAWLRLTDTVWPVSYAKER